MKSKLCLPRRSFLRSVCRYVPLSIRGCLNLVDGLIKFVGPCFIIFAFSLLSLETYVYFLYILPSSELSIRLRVIETFIGLFLLINVLVSYCKSFMIDPGQPPAVADIEMMEEEGGASPMHLTCKKCNRSKPTRCHHCSICNRCVLKMDHHCPWLNQCVGFHNHKFFLQFLFWLFVGCIFVVIVYFEVFVQCLRKISMRDVLLGVPLRQLILISWTVAAAVGVAIVPLGGMHVYLVCSNQTTIEFQQNFNYRRSKRNAGVGVKWRNPYNLGRCQNLRQVFGPSRFPVWLLPYCSLPPEGDGISFATV